MRLSKGGILDILLCKQKGRGIIRSKERKRKNELSTEAKKLHLPVRLAVILTIIAPVMAKPVRKGQFLFHSRRKNIGHGSNFLISLSPNNPFLFKSICKRKRIRHATPNDLVTNQAIWRDRLSSAGLPLHYRTA